MSQPKLKKKKENKDVYYIAQEFYSVVCNGLYDKRI